MVVAAAALIGWISLEDDDSDTSDVPASARDSAAAATPGSSSRPSAEDKPSDESEARQRVDRTTPRPDPTAEARREPERGSTSSPEGRRLYPVLDVVDGDTVKVGYRGGVSVRVIGIDTPETVHPSQPDECWGEAASNAGKRLLTGRQVALVFDPTQGRTDAYGRTLAYLAVPGLGDYGLTMIKRGHAAEYTYDTAYRRQARYRSAEEAARSAGKAMWGTCGGPDVPVADPAPTPRQGSQPSSGGGCAAGYDPCVPPYPPDVDCADVDGPVRVTGDDPHGLDGDGDGAACES